MRRILLASCIGAALMLICSNAIWAQDRKISGKVISAEDGTGLPGVNVVVKGTTVGTVTDADGVYSLSAPSDATILVFTFIGLETSEETIGTRSVVDVKMAMDAKQLGEVVVVETGYTQERKFVGSAVVLGKDISENAPMVSLDQSLQGRAAGVLVNSGSGQPGSSATVRIRGVSSIAGAGAQPLYVIDGVPVLGALAAINSNDIESQTVLKDGSTGALYGARGANGVIVINTKKGTPGERPTFEYRSQYAISMQPPPQNFNMMNTEQTLQYEEMVGLAGFGSTGPGWVWSPNNPTYATQTEAVKAERDAGLAAFRNNRHDYADILFRNGVSTTNEIALRGATDASRYYTSFNVFDQDGFAEGSGFKRYTGRVNLDQRLDKLTFTLMSTIVSSQTNSSVGDWLGNSPGNPFQIVWRAKPYEQIWKNDGSLDVGTSAALAPKNIANILDRQENTIYRQTDLRILGALGLKYEIVPGLSLRNNFGVDINYSQGMYSIKPDSYVGSTQTNGNSGYHTENLRNQSQIINTTSLNFSRMLGGIHEVEAGAYFEALKVTNNGMGYFLYNLDKRLSETGQYAGTLPVSPGQESYPQNNAAGAKSKYGIRSYFATTRYTYNDKYTVNLNARVDGTSRILNEKNKEMFTWSAGLGWDATNEEFLKTQNTITELKLRATYGAVPNIGSIPPTTYSLPGAFFTVPNYLGPQLPSFGASSAFAGSAISAMVPTSLGNPHLKIEYVNKWDIGVDVAVFNKVRLVLDLYKNTTVDMFVNQPMPATTGFGGTTMPVNAGQMTNKGIESTILADLYKKGDWTIEASWNHAINVNNIDDLGAVDEYPLGTFLIREGLPYGSHYTFDYLGADAQSGKPLYRKADGTIVDASADAGQVAKFGTFLPKHIGGVSLSAKYKKIRFSTLFTYQTDVVRSNNVWNWVTRGVPGYYNAVNQSTVLLENQWMQPGDQKFYQSPQYDRGFTSSDLMDAKFLRLREVTISYTLPKVKYFKSIRVYGRAQNLKIWSPWKGLDPEDDNNISLNEYPNPRMFVFGLDFSL
jgi:TonB-linked SusC/RagA family outer membrane protein